ncbi:MAG: DNA polymerase III subunit delta [Pseudomonadota bacterium]
MDPVAAAKDVASGRLKPVYMLHGAEIIARDRLLDDFRRLVPDGLRDFNLLVLHAEETSAREALSQARTMPFPGPPKVVIVKGFDRYSAEDLELFHQYLDDPNDAVCLVLVADKIDNRLKFYKSAVKKGLDVAFESPKGRLLVQWVRDAVARRGLAMNEETALALIDQLGTDLMELEGEIEKLSLFALGGKTVDADLVRKVARVTPTASVFQLGDALGEQKPGLALACLGDLLVGSAPHAILAMLVRHFRLLARARVLSDRRVSQKDAAGALGVPPFVVGKLFTQARSLEFQDIKKGLALLQEANLALISTGPPDGLVMEKLVLDLSSLRQRGRRPGPYGPF